MPQLDVKQIVIEGKGKIEIFHFQQESVDSEKKGYLFFVGQISHAMNPRDSLYYLLNSLAAALKREYYSPVFPQHGKAFEIGLKRANDILLTLSEENRNNLELSILVFRKNQISFSVIGNSEILLIRGDELFKLSRSASVKKRVFKNIIKGTLKDRDRIIIATSKIAPLLNQKTFISRLVKRSFDRLEDYLKKEGLLRKEDKSGLALLHIAVGVPSESTLRDQDDAISTDSIQKEDNRGKGDLRGLKYQSDEVSLQPTLPFDKNKELRLWAFVFNAPMESLKGILSVIKKYPAGKKLDLVSQKLRLFSSILRKPIPFSIIPFLPAFSQRERRLTFPSSSAKSKRTKNIWIVSLIIIAGFLALFFFEKKHTQSLVVKKPAFQNDQSKSGELILTFENFKESFDAGFLSQKRAFLFAQKNMYDADALTKNIEPLSSITRPLAVLSDVNNTFLFLIKEDKKLYLATYKPEQKSITKEVLSWPLQDKTSAKDMSLYSSNIYILDNESKQILKYSKNDFLSPKFWFADKNKIPLNNPVSLTSDESIYVLDLPSKIIQFRLGKKVREFGFNEKFSSQAKLRLLGKDYLSIADPQNKRFLLIDKKQGKTVKSETLSSLGEMLTPSSEEILDIFPLQESQELMILTKSGVFKKVFSIPK